MAINTLVDPSRMQMLFGSYGVGKAQCMADPFVPLKAQEYGFRAGLALLAALFVFATWNDLTHLGIVHWVAGLFG